MERWERGGLRRKTLENFRRGGPKAGELTAMGFGGPGVPLLSIAA